MTEIKLTPRLAVVASLVEKCEAVADIGTDHGFVPVYLVQNNICKRVVASDINEGPLNSAVRTAQNFSVTDRLEFVCSPGLNGVKPGSVDAVVVAGMGGETIVEILKMASWVKEYKTQLVLQPQSKFELFEDYLKQNGFSVYKAVLVKDAGRLYIAFSVRFTGECSNGDITYFAEHLKNDPLFVEYIEGILKKLELRERGLKSAKNPDMAELEYISKTKAYLQNSVLEVNTNGNS